MEGFAIVGAIACAVFVVKRLLAASEAPEADSGHWISPRYQARRKRAIRSEFAAYAAMREGIK